MINISEYCNTYGGLIVSDGTCRDGDLLAQFLPILENFGQKYEKEVSFCLDFINKYGLFGWLDELKNVADFDDYNRMEYIVGDWMWEEMENLSPDGFYFGANEGDGACFGFWRYEEDAL